MAGLLTSAIVEELVHPVSKKRLLLETTGIVLTEPASGDTFDIKDGLPILLPPRQERNASEIKYEDHYSLDAEVYDYFEAAKGTTERQEIHRLHDYILAEVPDRAKSVLDVGCGGGWLAGALLPKGKHVISMDISELNPRKVATLYPQKEHSAIVADALYLPFRYDSIDCIVASEIVEHVPDPARFLLSLFEILRPGGKMIITTPHNELIRYSLCIHCNHNTPHNAHLHSFTEATITTMAPPNAVNLKTKLINAKALSLLRVMGALSMLPFPLYRVTDRFIIGITGRRANRLMLVMEKGR